MPSSFIPGFVKKRTASQRYRRSPRQLTRDITVALEMRDEATLSHLRIRTEGGEVIEAMGATSELIKTLRDDGRNPMWYLRTTWLEETFGRRQQGDTSADEAKPSEDAPAETPAPKTMVSDDELTRMLKETIQELREDKKHLVSQIQIKDGHKVSQIVIQWKTSPNLSTVTPRFYRKHCTLT